MQLPPVRLTTTAAAFGYPFMNRLLLLTLLPASMYVLFVISVDQSVSPQQAMTPRELRNQERIEKLDPRPLPTHQGPRVSDRFPDILLTDQYGKEHRFVSDLVRDHTVCLVLFFTECTGTCPGTTQVMKRLREAARNEFPTDEIRFVSITLDPDIDDPNILLHYAESRGLGPQDGLADWYFLTGEFSELEQLRRALGLYDLDPEIDADRSEHASLITFGNDRHNRWASMPAGLGFDDLNETLCRICGNSQRQRFEMALKEGRMVEDNTETNDAQSQTAGDTAACCEEQLSAEQFTQN